MLFRQKRGDLALQQIVLLILALVVLVTILYIFRVQISSFAQKLFSVSSSIDLPSGLQNILE